MESNMDDLVEELCLAHFWKAHCWQFVIIYSKNNFKLSYHHNPACCHSRCIQNHKYSKNYQPDYDSFVHSLHYHWGIHQYLNNIVLLYNVLVIKCTSMFSTIVVNRKCYQLLASWWTGYSDVHYMMCIW